MNALPAVYVPRLGSWVHRQIVAGSGVVGRPVAAGGLELYFEGNVYGAVNLVTWCDRVARAAERQAVSYPTVARLHCERFEVVQVGWYDAEQGWIDLLRGQKELTLAWLHGAQLSVDLDAERRRSNG